MKKLQPCKHSYNTVTKTYRGSFFPLHQHKQKLLAHVSPMSPSILSTNLTDVIFKEPRCKTNKISPFVCLFGSIYQFTFLKAFNQILTGTYNIYTHSQIKLLQVSDKSSSIPSKLGGLDFVLVNLDLTFQAV